ncbi:AAA family ATPase [Flavobacteriaceae bacterium XHP0103]|uniref:AAA family ATPase n=1 Tax=Marixanthotalea marina TaxID=2844359 RepID=UPI002989D113|nr:AAA family ATPase [Marixanthotalea marina]MBU3823160.1 AAA family ATPase [Marixanthotalea marina]
MEIKAKNFGPLESINFSLEDFSVITGFNNTGKTYISYALYGFLKTWSNNIKTLNLEELIEVLLSEGSIDIELKDYEKKVFKNFRSLSDTFSKNLHKIFSANENEFDDTTFSFSIDEASINYTNGFEIEVKRKNQKIIKARKESNSSILKILLSSDDSELKSKRTNFPPKYFLIEVTSQIINRGILHEVLPEPYIITSERTGINIFQNELDINKNVLFEKLVQSDKKQFDFDPFDYLDDVVDRYSIPIKDGIDRIRNIDSIHKKNSYIYKQHPEIVKKIEKITGIGYKNIKGEYFITYKKGRKKVLLPMYLGSASSRALVDLYLFIRHTAEKGQLLIIDEPELNLHPSVQINIARLLASLSNIGIKVLITTHSDYIVKELNNLLMLSKGFTEKENFLKKFKYEDNEYLNSMNFYIAENKKLDKIEIDEFGLKRTNFDKSIETLIEISETLYNKLS